MPLWEHGQIIGHIDAMTAGAQGYVIVDLGEGWTPYLFTESASPDVARLVNSYRETYLRLARGEFPDDAQGRRARDDKYLELYGIMPTLGWLRERMHRMAGRECVRHLDFSALTEYAAVHGNSRPPVQAIEEAQRRLACEEFLPEGARHAAGVLDAPTRRALTDFERRHHVYGWGSLAGDTLAMLQVPPLNAELQGLVRVLSERAIHAAGVLEDGSTSTLPDGQTRTFLGVDGGEHPLPNLVAELRQRVIGAFALQTPESALSWLASLGELPAGEHRFAAFRGPDVPEYYSEGMDLTVQLDRGDVWYDFPYDEGGQALSQPVQRRPAITVSVRHLGQSIPLARYPTTVGGWRAKQIGNVLMWRYQESPVGKRVWNEIVAAPVWRPPDTTQPKALLKRKQTKRSQAPAYEVNYELTGPGYASAFGLVAAYHSRFGERADGTIAASYDEGIRTHGSVDYMGIIGRQSNGCHRLHNHIAVRLMSWVLAHRPHQRKGQLALPFRKTVEYEESVYELALDHGGYAFELTPPLEVEVLEGRIRGKLKRPIRFEIPMYDKLLGAYVTAEGRAVQLRNDQLVEVPLPARVDSAEEGSHSATPTSELDYRVSPALVAPAFNAKVVVGKPEA